jgi:hypothetical protein
MANRALKIATAVSLVLLIASLALLPVSACLDPSRQFLSLSSSFHVTVWQARVVAFNDASYGPYHGSTIAVSSVGVDGVVHPLDHEEVKFGDSWGIYYRYFRWPNATLWTLMVSLIYPILAFAALPLVGVARKVLASRRGRGRGGRAVQ